MRQFRLRAAELKKVQGIKDIAMASAKLFKLTGKFLNQYSCPGEH